MFLNNRNKSNQKKGCVLASLLLVIVHYRIYTNPQLLYSSEADVAV